MEKKNKLIAVLLAVIILLVILIVCVIIFKKTYYTVTFNTDGGSKIEQIKVEENDTFELPKNPSKDGYTFVGWINKEGRLVTNSFKLDSDINLKAMWISNKDEIVIITFEGIGDVKLVKESNIILPVDPVKKGYKFIGWLDEDGKLISSSNVITSNKKLKAYYVKNDSKTYTVSIDTDGGNKIGNYDVVNDEELILPETPTKDGYVFAGWVDSDGNKITSDTKISGNITIKATWKTPYTCPSECTPVEDGSKCTKKITVKKTTTNTCSDGSKILENGRCMTGSRYMAELENGNWICNSSTDYKYTEEEAGGATMWCQPTKSSERVEGCPKGYTEDNGTCKKTETLKCTAN